MEAIKHAIKHYKKRVRSLDCKIWEEEILKLLEKQLQEVQGWKNIQTYTNTRWLVTRIIENLKVSASGKMFG